MALPPIAGIDFSDRFRLARRSTAGADRRARHLVGSGVSRADSTTDRGGSLSAASESLLVERQRCVSDRPLLARCTPFGLADTRGRPALDAACSVGFVPFLRLGHSGVSELPVGHPSSRDGGGGPVHRPRRSALWARRPP